MNDSNAKFEEAAREGADRIAAKVAEIERDQGFVEVKENPARAAARDMLVVAGIQIDNFAQLVDFAKYMSGSGYAVAKPLRGNLGACIRVISQASRWGFDPFDLAIHCYLVNDVLAYDSQLIHAIVEKFAPIKNRLRPIYDGKIEDGTRTCRITGHFVGELEPLEYTSPPLSKISPQNSPLWKTDPDQQLFYFATRRWARRYCPDVLLGAYAKDELEDSEPLHIGFDNAKDVSPMIAERLKATKGDEGFVGQKTIESINASLEAARTKPKERVGDEPANQGE